MDQKIIKISKLIDNVNQSGYCMLEMIAMATAPTQIRIDSDIKKQATDTLWLFPNIRPYFFFCMSQTGNSQNH